METLEIILSEHPCLKELDPKYIKTLLGCASPAKFEPDQLVFSEGNPANKFFLIRHGRVGLEINVPNQGLVTIETVGAGEILGWSWIVAPYICHFSALAKETTGAIAMDGGRVREMCLNDHELGYQLYSCFIDSIVHWLQATRLQLLDVYHVRV